MSSEATAAARTNLSSASTESREARRRYAWLGVYDALSPVDAHERTAVLVSIAAFFGVPLNVFCPSAPPTEKNG